jgi:hypothetical protein
MKKYLGVLTGVVMVALASAGPAAARIPAPDLQYRATGGIDYTWVGVPARGCAGDGMCGVEGSLQVTADGSSGSSGSQPQVTLEDDTAVVRVEYPAVGATPEYVCAEPMPYQVGFALRPAHGDDALPVGAAFPYGLASSGECAGPTGSELGALRLPVRRQPDGGYSLAATKSFGAGPFEVTVTSHLGVRSSPENGGGIGASQAPGSVSLPRARKVLDEQVNVDYRLVAVDEALVDGFGGVADPFCEPLGACGTTGSIHMQLAPGRDLLEITGQRIVKRHIGLRRALEDLRAGKLAVYDNGFGNGIRYRTTSVVSRPGTPSCAGAASGQIGFDSQVTRTTYEFYLEPNGTDFFFGGADALRTWCPGPESTTIVGQGAIASGAFKVASLGAPRIEVRLTNAGRFVGPGYHGTRTGSVVLMLVRTRVMGGTRRARAINGQLF